MSKKEQRTYEQGVEDGRQSAEQHWKTRLDAADTEIAHLRKQVATAEDARLAGLNFVEIADAMRLGGPRHPHRNRTRWDGTDHPCEECTEWWRVFDAVAKAIHPGGPLSSKPPPPLLLKAEPTDGLKAAAETSPKKATLT